MTWKKAAVKTEARTNRRTFRQKAKTLRNRLSIRWTKVLGSFPHRTLKTATSLIGGTLTWLQNLINQNRTAYVRRQKHKIMTRQFHAAVQSCYKHNKISRKEMKEARRKWREAMKNVKEEDKRRKKLWGEEQMCVTEQNQ